jgi:hypothetical protein
MGSGSPEDEQLWASYKMFRCRTLGKIRAIDCIGELTNTPSGIGV